MVHVKKISVAKAESDSSIEDWFKDLWKQISNFFKGKD